MKRFHYSWTVCAACTLLLVCTLGATSSSFTVYMPYIKAQGYSGTVGSSILSVRCFVALVSMLLIETYYSKLSLRAGLTVACLLAATGFVSYAFSTHILMYYFSSVLCGLAYGFGSMIPVSILMRRWFYHRRAFAIAICSAGTGICMIAFPPIITLLIERYGLSFSFLAEATFLAVCAVGIYMVLRNDPAEMGLKPYGWGNDHDKPHTSGIRSGKSIPKGRFFVVLASMLLLGGVGTAGPGHFSVLFATEGYSVLISTAAVSVFGISLTTGKFVYGWVSDIIGCCRSTTLFLFILMAGCYSCYLSNGKSALPVFLGVILMGFGYPPATVGLSVWASDFSDESSFPKTLKWFQFCFSFGGMIFVSIPGLIFDIIGSYRLAYFMFFCVIPIVAWVIWRTYCYQNLPTQCQQL